MAGTTFTITLNAETAAALEKIGHFGESFKAVMERLGMAFSVEEVLRRFTELVRAYMEHAEALLRVGQSVGIVTEQLSGLEYAAKREGVELETLRNGLKGFAQWLDKTHQSTGDMNAALMEQARIFSSMADGPEKLALATERFGRAGAQMIPFLNQGPEGLRALIERGKELTGITEKTAETAKSFKDTMLDTKLAAEALAFTISSGLVKAVGDSGVKFADALVWMRGWADAVLKGWGSLMAINPVNRFLFGTKGVSSSEAEIAGRIFDEFQQHLNEYIKSKGGDGGVADFKTKLEALKEMGEYLKLTQFKAEQNMDSDPATKFHEINGQLQSRINNLEKQKDLLVQGVISGAISREENDRESSKLDSLIEKLKAELANRPETWIGQTDVQVRKMVEAWGTAAQQIGATIKNTIGTAIETVSSQIAGVIVGTRTWADAVRQIGVTIATQVVQAIIEMGAKWVVTHLVMGQALTAFHALAKALGWAEVADTNAQSAAKTPGLAMTATLASASSYGAAAIVGIAALLAAIGIGVAAALGAFESGGYTGAGGVHDVAGLVHRGEYVISAPAVSRIGIGALDAMHYGGGGPGVAGGAGATHNVTILSDERKFADLRNDPSYEGAFINMMNKHSWRYRR